MKSALGAVLLVVFGGVAVAQHQHNAPYAGLQQRGVKALSEEQVSDLRAGRGMGLSLAAELNGYPGPFHVLELADQLELGADLRQKARELFEAMKAEAIPAGNALIAREADLDRAFVERKISGDNLSVLTAKIGEAQAQLRAIHLKYHLMMTELLSPSQRQRYAQLRGYL